MTNEVNCDRLTARRTPAGLEITDNSQPRHRNVEQSVNSVIVGNDGNVWADNTMRGLGQTEPSILTYQLSDSTKKAVFAVASALRTLNPNGLNPQDCASLHAIANLVAQEPRIK